MKINRIVNVKDSENRTIDSLSYVERKRVAIEDVLAMRQNVLAPAGPSISLDPVGAGEMIRSPRGLDLAIPDMDVDPLFADRIRVLNADRIVLEGPQREVSGKAEEVDDGGLRLPVSTQLFEALERREGHLTLRQIRRMVRDKRW